MAGDELEIGLRHMPDDFLDNIDMHPAADHGVSADKLIATGANLEAIEHSLIRKSLEAHGGNVSVTARAGCVAQHHLPQSAESEIGAFRSLLAPASEIAHP